MNAKQRQQNYNLPHSTTHVNVVSCHIIAFIGRWDTLITSLSSSVSADLQFNISHNATNHCPLCNISGPSSSNLSLLQLFQHTCIMHHVMCYYLLKKHAQLTTMQSSFVFSALYSWPCMVSVNTGCQVFLFFPIFSAIPINSYFLRNSYFFLFLWVFRFAVRFFAANPQISLRRTF